MRFGKKSRAVISVFLILTMMPLLGLAVVLVDGSRVQSAKMMVQEASDLAAVSTLAGYNKQLKDDYGLFAVKNPDQAQSVFESFLKASLTEAVGGDKEYSDQLYNAVKGMIFKDSKISGFTDLFHYSIGDTKLETLYTLDQKEVLQNQIVEYTKYRGAYFLADRLSLLSKISEMKQEYEDSKKSAELMEEKLTLDEEADKSIDQKVDKLNKKIDAFAAAAAAASDSAKVTAVKDNMRIVVDAAEAAYSAHINDEAWQSDLSAAWFVYMGDHKDLIQTTLHNECEEMDQRGKDAHDLFQDIKIDDVNTILSNIQTETEKLEKFRDEKVNTSSAGAAEEMKKDVQETLEKYQEYADKMNALKTYMGSAAYQEDKKHLEMARTMYGNAYSAIVESLIDEINSPMMKEDPPAMRYHGLKIITGTGGTQFISDGSLLYKADKARGNYYGTWDDGCPYYSALCGKIPDRMKGIDLYEDKSNEDKKDEATQKIKEANEKEDSFHGNTIPDAEYALLPSKGEGVNDKSKTTYHTDVDEVTKDTHSILSGAGNFLENLVTTTRDEALTYSYIFGMFKTRMSDSARFCAANKPSNWSEYHVQWRYEHEDGEHDLRERAKASQQTVLNAEVEYIFGGHKSDTANCASVYAWIYGTRAANNLIAVYKNSEARTMCYELGAATAAAVSAATLGAVTLSPKVYQWIYITAWAVMETSKEMDYLVNDGYRIPLIKTGKNLIIKNMFSLTDLDKNLEKSVKDTAINVCYEDYLLILTLIGTSSETRVRRVADLIQLNMRDRYGGDFLMNQAPTYIKAETGVSMNYLFQQFSQFSEFYPGKGIRFKNTIYQGY